MNILTERMMIQSVAQRWRDQYSGYKANWPVFTRPGLTMADVGNELEALDKDTCSREEVLAVTNNDSWLRMQCEECKQVVELLLLLKVGKLCTSCITKAEKMLADHNANLSNFGVPCEPKDGWDTIAP